MAKKKTKTANKKAVKKTVVKKQPLSFRERAFAFFAKESTKKTLNLVKGILFVAIVALAAVSLLSTLSIRTPIKPFVVLSGSMRPTIYEGSVAFVSRGSEGLKNGDIITFIRPDNFQENVTHRIVGEEATDGKILYKTKGDANNTTDAWVVRKEAIWGKVAFTIPLLGYAVNFSKTRLGVILLVVIPLILISLDEVRIIRKELKKIRGKKKSKAKVNTKAIVAFLIFILPIINSNIASTAATWTDNVSATGNQAETGFWVPPTVTVTAPVGGETFYHQNTYNIEWTATPGCAGCMIIDITISYSVNGGAFNTIASGEVNDGIYSWTVPNNIFSNNVVIQVTATDINTLSGSDVSGVITVKSPIVINEFMANPAGNGTDNDPKPDGEWVELYNLGTVAIDVNGWYIYSSSNIPNHELLVSAANSDNNQNLLDAGETVVPTLGFLVVYRNGDPDFNLIDGKDQVRVFNGLASAGGILVDSQVFAGTLDGVTKGTIPDGADAFVDNNPTPGASNVAYVAPLVVLSQEVVQTVEVIEATPTPSPVELPSPSPSPLPEVLALPSEIPSPSPLPTETPTVEFSPTPMPSIEPTTEPAPTPSAVDVIQPVQEETINV